MFELVTAPEEDNSNRQITQNDAPKPIKVIAIDLDGVLFNSGAHTATINGEEVDLPELHRFVFNQALKVYGQPTISDDEASQYIGKTSKTKLAMLADKDGVPVPKELYEDISKLKTKLTLDELPKYATPNEEHHEALATLKAEGYKLVLTSNSDPETLKQVMKLTGLDQYFDYMLSNKDVKNPKPAPDIYNLAGKKEGVSQDELMFIEDTDVGATAGLKAKIPVGMKVEGPDDVNLENIHEFIQDAEELKLEKWQERKELQSPQTDSSNSLAPLIYGRHVNSGTMETEQIKTSGFETPLQRVLQHVINRAQQTGFDPVHAVNTAVEIDARLARDNAPDKSAEMSA